MLCNTDGHLCHLKGTVFPLPRPFPCHQITEEAAAHLKEAGVGCKQYEDLLEEVKALAASGSRIVMDPAKVRPSACSLLAPPFLSSPPKMVCPHR